MRHSGWKEAILEAERNEYFQGEILFSFYLLGIQASEEATTDHINEFIDLWKEINQVIAFAKGNDVLFHRALLTYGDYDTQAPGGVGNYGVHSFYQYTEKHHNYDWRGMLRPEIGEKADAAQDRREIFKRFLSDCKSENPESVAARVIAAYPNTHSTCLLKNPDDNLWKKVREKLIKHDEMFSYCSKYYYIWHDEEERGGPWNRYCLMQTSKRNRYIEALAYAEYLELHEKHQKEKNRREGGNPSEEKDRHSWVRIDGVRYEYRKDGKREEYQD